MENYRKQYRTHTITPPDIQIYGVCPIVIIGEPGLYKSEIAKKIHEISKRQGKFVYLNMESCYNSDLQMALKEADEGTLCLGKIHRASDRMLKEIARIEDDPFGEIDVKFVKTAISWKKGFKDIYLKPLREYSEKEFNSVLEASFPGPQFKMSEQDYKILRNYYWPGNLRELHSVITLACKRHYPEDWINLSYL